MKYFLLETTFLSSFFSYLLPIQSILEHNSCFDMKTIFLPLFCCIVLLSSCAKQRIDPTGNHYFLGEWTLSGGPLSTPNPIPTTVIFQELGKVIFDTHILISPSQGTQTLTQDWKYNQASRALILNQGQDVYSIRELSASQFTVTHQASGKGLTFTKL